MELFIPGRLCLFGSHADWNAENVGFGHALAVSTSMGVYARAWLEQDRAEEEQVESRLFFTTPDGRTMQASLDESALSALAQDGTSYFAYVCGAASAFLRHYPQRNTPMLLLHIHNYKTDLPEKKGLSSSAAICVLVVRAMSQLLLARQLPEMEEAEIAYQGERLTPSQCGRLDQVSVSCLSANPGQVGLIRFGDGESDITCSLIPGPPVRLFLLLVALRGEKDTITILHALQSHCKQQQQQNDALRNLFGEFNQEIVQQAVRAITRESSSSSSSSPARLAKTLGALANRAQEEFDRIALPVCRSELTAPHLHAVLQDARVREWSCGGKFVGAGGDGTCVLFAETQENLRKLKRLLDRELAEHVLECWEMIL